MQPTRRHIPPAPRQITTYWDRVQWPIHALYFLTPLLLAYELGAWYYAPQGGERLPLIFAEKMLHETFEWFGVTGYYLPGLIVVVLLLCWHLVRRDPWRPEPSLYVGMSIESLLLAVPLFVFMLVLVRQPPMAAGVEGVANWQSGLVFSIGAGIYEELLFRVIGIALLHLILSDLIDLPPAWAAGGAVVVSALAFALYHFEQPNPWYWREFWAGFHGLHFVFYMVAGVYFAGVYVTRGFGVVAAAHAFYDILVFLRLFQPWEG